MNEQTNDLHEWAINEAVLLNVFSRYCWYLSTLSSWTFDIWGQFHQHFTCILPLLAVFCRFLINFCFCALSRPGRHAQHAKCGTPMLFIWPIVGSIETPSEWVHTYLLWPLNIAKTKIWPAMRFELCTPVLGYTA